MPKWLLLIAIAPSQLGPSPVGRPSRRGLLHPPLTRLLLFSFLWLVISYGIRSVATSTSLNGPVQTWLDAIVLPAILFVACERYCLLGADRIRRLAGALMIAGGVLGAIGIAERIFGFELASVTGGSVRFDAVIDQTRISGPYPVPEPYALTLIVCFAATLYWVHFAPAMKQLGVGSCACRHRSDSDWPRSLPGRMDRRAPRRNRVARFSPRPVRPNVRSGGSRG